MPRPDEVLYRRVVSPSGRVTYQPAGRVFDLHVVPPGVHAMIVSDDATERTVLYGVDPRPPERAWLLCRRERAVKALTACQDAPQGSSTVERVDAVLQAVDPNVPLGGTFRSPSDHHQGELP